MADDEREVDIAVKAIGPSPPSSIRVPSHLMVSELRSLVSLDRNLPGDRLKLILKGGILQDKSDDGRDLGVRIDNGVVAVMPIPPAKHLQEEDEEEEDLVRT